MRSSYRLALAGAAAACLLAAGCSSSGSSSGSSSSATNWATQSSASAGGGMTALVAAAKKEGTLNVIALPPTWANYGAILSAFTAKYGIKINSALPDGSSQQEVDAVKSQHGTAKAPDVLDVGMAVALANTKLFAPYKVSTWGDIPSAQKDPGGLWYQDYGGYMAIGYSSKFGTITSLNQLLDPKFHNAVALNGNPTSANAALNGVMMANLAVGGSLDDVSKGIDWFKHLKQIGNFSKTQATTATVKNGTTPVVFDWDYLSAAHGKDVPTWKVFVPNNAILGGYYAQAISKTAPHPAAARLWEEYLYSDEGQNLWLAGLARPVRMAAMQSSGKIDAAAAAKLPPVNGTPQFMSDAQSTAAKNYVVAHWDAAIA